MPEFHDDAQLISTAQNVGRNMDLLRFATAGSVDVWVLVSAPV